MSGSADESASRGRRFQVGTARAGSQGGFAGGRYPTLDYRGAIDECAAREP
jgi:hypothetical protein